MQEYIRVIEETFLKSTSSTLTLFTFPKIRMIALVSQSCCCVYHILHVCEKRKREKHCFAHHPSTPAAYASLTHLISQFQICIFNLQLPCTPKMEFILLPVTACTLILSFIWKPFYPSSTY